jgi:hypothetical protein
LVSAAESFFWTIGIFLANQCKYVCTTGIVGPTPIVRHERRAGKRDTRYNLFALAHLLLTHVREPPTTCRFRTNPLASLASHGYLLFLANAQGIFCYFVAISQRVLGVNMGSYKVVVSQTILTQKPTHAAFFPYIFGLLLAKAGPQSILKMVFALFFGSFAVIPQFLD